MNGCKSMHAFGHPLRACALLLTILVVASCAGDRLSTYEMPAPTGAPAATTSTPPINMAGRWLLTSPGHGQCNMTFAAPSPAASEGTIAPAGGCPGKFFTSRKWAYEQGSLVIRDHTGTVLAQLSRSGSGFDGKASTGEPVALIR
jgi:hypothetical protein